MEFKDLLTIFKRRTVTIILCVVAVMAVFFAQAYQEPPRFSAAARVTISAERLPMTPAEQQYLDANVPGGVTLPTRQMLLDAYDVYRLAGAIRFAYADVERASGWSWKDKKDDEVLQRLVETQAAEVEFYGPLPASLKVSQAAPVLKAYREMQARVRIRQPLNPQATLYTVTAEGSSEAEVLDFVNVYARAAELYSVVRGVNVYRRADEAIKKQIRQASERIENAKMLAPAAEEFIGLEDEAGRVRGRIDELARAIDRKNATLDADRQELEALAAAAQQIGVAIGPRDVFRRVTSPLLEEIRRNIHSILAEMSERSITWTPENPQYKALTARLAAFRERETEELRRAAQERLSGLKGDIDRLTAEVQGDETRRLTQQAELRLVTERLKQARPAVADIDALKAEIARAREGEMLIEKMMASHEGFFKFEEEAREADRIAGPAYRGAGLWILMAVVVALGAAYVKELIDTNIYTDYDMRRHLNLPVLSLFPRLPRGESPLLTAISVKSPLAEAFHRAATILRTMMAEKKSRTVMVTSAVPREGKTTISVNLAIAFARKGLKTMLIDADLRLPEIHELFKLDRSTGIATLLAAGPDAALRFAEYVRPSGVEHLDILVCGPTPAEPVALLESHAMKVLVGELKAQYDVIVFDAPPVTNVGDPLILAGLVENVVLVVGSGLSERRGVTWAKHLLGTVKANVVGGFLNFARRHGSDSYYYYYYYGYGTKKVRHRP